MSLSKDGDYRKRVLEVSGDTSGHTPEEWMAAAMRFACDEIARASLIEGEAQGLTGKEQVLQRAKAGYARGRAMRAMERTLDLFVPDSTGCWTLDFDKYFGDKPYVQWFPEHLPERA